MRKVLCPNIFKSTCLIWLGVVVRASNCARNCILPLLFSVLITNSANAVEEIPPGGPPGEQLLNITVVSDLLRCNLLHTYIIIPFKGAGTYTLYTRFGSLGYYTKKILDNHRDTLNPDRDRNFAEDLYVGTIYEIYAPEGSKVHSASKINLAAPGGCDDDTDKKISEIIESLASAYLVYFKPDEPEPEPLKIKLTGPVSLPPVKRGGNDSFSLTLSVKNEGDEPLTNLENLGLFKSGISADNNGEAIALEPLNPPLPATLATGAEHIGSYLLDPIKDGPVLIVAKVKAGEYEDSSGVRFDIGQLPTSDADLDTALHGLWIQFLSGLEVSAKEYQQDFSSMVVASTLDNAANLASSCGMEGQVTQTLPEPNALEKSLARASGLPDNAFVWLPDDPIEAMEFYFAWKEGKAEGYTKATETLTEPLRVAADTYIDLIKNPDFRDGFIRDLSTAVKDGKGTVDGVLQEAYSFYGKESPLRANAGRVIKSSIKQIPEAIEKKVKSICEDTSKRIQARADANGGDITKAAAKEFGSIYGEGEALIATEVALDMGSGGAFSAIVKSGQTSRWIGRLSEVLDRDLKLPLGLGKHVNIKLPQKKSKTRKKRSTSHEVDGTFRPRKDVSEFPAPVPGTFDAELNRQLRAAGVDPEDLIPPLGTVGGIHPIDQQKIQTIINDLKAEYADLGYPDIDLEYSVRGTNPFTAAKLRDANGNLLMTPKNELMKSKSITAEDIMLGADPKFAGEVALYEPRLPHPDVWAKLSSAERSSLQRRAKKQLKAFDEYHDTSSDFRKLIERGKKPGGSPELLNAPGGKALREVPFDVSVVETDSGMIRILDKANGNRPFGSDLDGHALLNSSGKTLPSGIKSQIELKFIRRLEKDGIAHGGHGWTKAAFDLESKQGKLRAGFLLENLPPEVARVQATEFIKKYNKTIDAHNAVPGNKKRKKLVLEDFIEEIEAGQKVVKITANNVKEDFGVDLVKLPGSGVK